MTEMSPTFALRSKDLEITRLKIVIDSYAASCAAAAREIKDLRDKILALEAIKPAPSDSPEPVSTPPLPCTPAEGTSQDGCIVARLRAEIAWEPDIGELLAEAAAEIERLHLALRRLADQNATFSVIGGNIIVDVDRTLTDAEREAIERVAIHCADTSCEDTAKTLWGLLQRLGY
jgi:hypothetical protein